MILLPDISSHQDYYYRFKVYIELELIRFNMYRARTHQVQGIYTELELIRFKVYIELDLIRFKVYMS